MKAEEAALKELARQGLSPTQRDFVRAVKSGQQAIVDLFLQAGVSIHTTDPWLRAEMLRNSGYRIDYRVNTTEAPKVKVQRSIYSLD